MLESLRLEKEVASLLHLFLCEAQMCEAARIPTQHDTACPAQEARPRTLHRKGKSSLMKCLLWRYSFFPSGSQLEFILGSPYPKLF